MKEYKPTQRPCGLKVSDIIKLAIAGALGATLYCCAPSRTYERRVTETHTVIVEERGEKPQPTLVLP